MDFLNKLKENIYEMSAFVPNLLTALGIFLLGYIVARVIRRFIRTILAKTGIDTLADKLNDIDLVHNSRINIVPSKLFSEIVYFVLILIVTMASVEALGMEAVSQLMTDIIQYLPKAVSAFLVLIVGLGFSDLIKKIVLQTCESIGIPSSKFIANIVFYFLFINVALIAMKQAELQTTFMENNISIIVGGVILAFSIGYGLASKSLMANMLSSYYFKDKISIGDEITVGNYRGKVADIDGTTMTLSSSESSSQGEVVIPLSKLSADTYVIHRKAAENPMIDISNSPDADK